jgi:hypothetical protein
MNPLSVSGRRKNPATGHARASDPLAEAAASQPDSGPGHARRRFLPRLIDLIRNRQIDPGKVFDLMLPLDQAAEACKAVDERRAIKALLQP